MALPAFGRAGPFILKSASARLYLYSLLPTSFIQLIPFKEAHLLLQKIRNAAGLLSHGDIGARAIVLDITNKVLNKLDSYKRLNSFMRLDGDLLHVGNKVWDLNQKRSVYVFTAGKAANHMAKAAEEALGSRMTKGIAIVKILEESDIFLNTEVFVGGHPLPNEEGTRGCLRMFELIDAADEKDLFIVLISGGSTALMGCPVDGITLEEKKQATNIMLKSNMRVLDINVIRGHISRTNRGNLGKRITERGSELISVCIWDAIGMDTPEDYGEPVAMMGTPVGADTSTFDDARRILREYDLLTRLPKSVIDHIENGGPEQETPKSLSRTTGFMLNVLSDSCDYALKYAEEMGIDCHVLSSSLEGESEDAGMVMACIAKEIKKTGRPFKSPCLVLSAGETTTKILDDNMVKGHGGPSHELAAGFALIARDIPGACLLSIDTEGTDGSTLMAGALTDSSTYERALTKGFDLHEALRQHATFEALSAVDDCVFTGNTGTNLCDFNIMYIP
jgi:glycerate-2-kinase